jgi:hypothetical protein
MLYVYRSRILLEIFVAALRVITAGVAAVGIIALSFPLDVAR